jgi:hypothetical protein
MDRRPTASTANRFPTTTFQTLAPDRVFSAQAASHPNFARKRMNQTGVLASPRTMTLSFTRITTGLLVLTAGLSGGCWPEDKSRSGRDATPEAEQEDDDPGAVDPDCQTKKVDLLFVIDNSGSMSQEQAKLARTVPSLLGILATGNHSGKRSNAGEPTDFAPAESIHVGVISTDLGINLAPAQNSCGDRSFLPTERDTRMSTQRINKPFGDDGALLSATEIAAAGIYAPVNSGEVELVVQPEPECAQLTFDEPYLTYEPSDLFEDTGFAFSCISKLGRNGCGLEQQLEAMLKALTPAQSHRFTFSRDTQGQGSEPGANAGFLREDAILAVVHVSDEEDCSIPDQSSGLFDALSTAIAGGINVRCGLPENQSLLHGIDRYVDGLRALKPARYRDRIVFASIVGLPGAEDTGAPVHSGKEDLEALLDSPEMQFKSQRNEANTDDEPAPACSSRQGDGSASPGRRFLQVAAAFGDQGLVASICDDSYQGLISGVSERISRHMGTCE